MALVKRDNQFSVATIQESTKEQNRTNVKVLDEETYVQVGHLQSYYDLFEELNRISESLFLYTARSTMYGQVFMYVFNLTCVFSWVYLLLNVPTNYFAMISHNEYFMAGNFEKRSWGNGW